MTESKRLGDLFARYQARLVPPQRTVENAIIGAIQKCTHVTLLSNQVSYTPASRIIYITAPSILKSEIKSKESEILSEAKNSIGPKNAPVTIL